MRLYRLIGFALATVVAFGLTVRLTYTAANSLVDAQPIIRLQVLELLERRVAALENHRGRPNVYRIAFLGDSTVHSYPYHETLPERLTSHFLRSGLVPKVVEAHSFAFPGLSPFEFYFFTDRILEAAPNLLILPVNLATSSPVWRSRMMSPELSVWLPPQRITQALTLPLNWMGLTVDRLMYYTGIGAMGWFDRLLHQSLEQARVGKVVDEFERRLVGNVIVDTAGAGPPVAGERLSAQGAIRNFGPALAGLDAAHPVLDMYAAVVRSYRAAGVPVLAYIVPANIEHFDALGVYDREKMNTTVRNITARLESAGATLVDLHDIFPDEMFRDATGHFRTDSEHAGTRDVASALAPYVINEIVTTLGEAR